MSTIKVAHIFYDIHMSYSHTSLGELLAKRLKKDQPDDGEIVLFIASNWQACKILAHGNSFLYHRSTDGELTLAAISDLPIAFGGAKLAFTKALATALLSKFERKAA